jgi:uncharacterized coiled-coil protein SlyX
MDKLKLIVACVIIVGLSQLNLNSGKPQRQYYTGSQAIKARQEAAAAGQLPTSAAGGDQGGCFGNPDNCPFTKTRASTPQDAAQAELNRKIAEHQKAMEEQAEQLRQMQEELEKLKEQTRFQEQSHDNI